MGTRGSRTDADREDEASRVVAHDVDGPFRHVETRHDAVEVDQRDVALHRQPQADILVMARVCPTIPIAQQAVVAKRVIVRTVLTFDDGNGRYAERDVPDDAGLEDALRTHERNALAVMLKPGRQHVPSQRTIVAGQARLLFKKLEGS